ncbi:MAG: right-handed parallel beta-helix repeat-containing protein [Verrucomicrobiota bacterium]|nr:right-handed parallel beta-helix repeat-containing protein [Verrucomicrobiota bacterium]
MKKSRYRCGTSLALFVSVLLAAASAEAATLTVRSTADAGGSCPGASCTLRQAIATAASGDTINFSLPANSAITLTSAELLINKNLTISGPGANLLTVQRSTAGGTPAFRIFEINPNSVIATISGLTVANGLAPGGGIDNLGNLTLTSSTISGNSANSFSSGGVANNGTLTIVNSTISGNSATFAGGLANGATLTITNSTISGNSASNDGGGMFNAGGTLTIVNSTIHGNSAANDGGGIHFGGGTVNVRNTIIAGNTAPAGPDVYGSLASQGYNLIGNTSDATIMGTTTGNQLNVDPVLGPLQNNGGATLTHALLSGSPAIEGGNSSGSKTDQRGLARPVDDPIFNNATGGDGSDIGAYEVQADQLPGCNNINRVVNNNNDSGSDSLRGVLASVCAGSTITFAPNVRGAINLTSGELLLNKSQNINGPGATLLSVQRSAGAGNFRIFNVTSASGVASISGLTIANGNSPGGNGGNGGGIYNEGATLTLSNCILSGNSTNSSAGGGGVFSSGGALTVRHSTLSGNTGGFGGGAINGFQGSVSVNNSTISGNTTNAGNGAGIYISGSSTMGNLTVTNSTISGNSATDLNSGFGRGGGIFNGGVTISVTNSTVAGNSAQFRGGGIESSGFPLVSRNTIIALNTAPSGPDVYGTLTSDNFNLIGNNSGVTITPAQFADQIGTPGSPINPLLGPLQNNGGPTFTRALLSGSPAIDKGNSSSATTDQRGVGYARIVDDPLIAPSSGGDNGDIGAFEFGAHLVAVSRKTHGMVDFDINLALPGTLGIESRTGGANGDHRVIVTFPTAVSLTSAGVTAGTGNVSSASVSGAQVTIDLTAVANAQKIVLTLFGVSDGVTTNDVDVPMGVLLGDSNGDATVNSGDSTQVRNRSGQATDGTNFRSDVNLDGSINSGDAFIVRARSGTSLSGPFERR